MPNTAKACRIAIKGRRKNLIGQAHPTQLSRVRIFVGAPTPAGRTSRAVAPAIARAPLIVEVSETVGEQGIGVEQARAVEWVVWEVLATVAERANLVAVAAQERRTAGAVRVALAGALAAGEVPLKELVVVAAPRGLQASVVAPAVVAAVAAVGPVVAEAAVDPAAVVEEDVGDAGKDANKRCRVKSDECRVGRC